MIGLGVATLFLVMNASLRKSIDKIVDDSFKGDYVVNTENQQAGVGLPSRVAQRINDLPDVQSAAGIRFGLAQVNGKSTSVSGVDPDTAFKLFDVDVKAGNVDGLNQGAIAVSKKKADDNHWKVGDKLKVRFTETGVHELPIAAIIDTQPFTGAYAVSTKTFEDNIPNQGDNLILVRLKDGVSPDQAKPSLDKIVNAYPTAKLQDLAEFKDSTKQGLNVILVIMSVLLLFTIVIAMVGIVNTLVLSVVERTREIGLTRAVGAFRSQIRSALRWEAVVIAAFGLMAALSIGIFFGWVLVSNMGDTGSGAINQFEIPFGQLVAVTLVTLVLTLLASLLPAAWAGRRPILGAIASE
jgi:putative ABC transport system permease protein